MNTHSFVGRIGNDLVKKSTQSGMTTVEFNVGVNDNRKQTDGTYKTFWFKCVAFDKTAEHILSYGFKGALISIVSKPIVEEYVDKKTNENRKSYKEICNEVSILSKKVETTTQEHVKTAQKPKVDTSSVYDDVLPDPDQAW